MVGRVNPQTLAKAAGISLDLAKTWADVLGAAMDRAEIITPLRKAMFLAQCGHESGGFSRLVESLDYTPEALIATWPARFNIASANALGRRGFRKAQQVQIGITAYGGRMGNMPPPSEDGWRYRGRGLIQVTGRDNYTRMASALGLDLLRKPELLEQPQNAALSAAEYWRSVKANQYADKGDVIACSALINTGNAASPPSRINGLADRQARYSRARDALGVR